MKNESLKEPLENLGLSSNQLNVILYRRVEGMSVNQVILFLLFFLSINIAVLLHIYLSPPLFQTFNLPFETQKEEEDVTRRFNLDFTDFHYFHDFFILSAVFNQSKAKKIESRIINVSLLSTLISKSHHRGTVVTPNQPFQVKFPLDSDVSEPMRLLSQEFINFNSLHSHIVLKNHENLSVDGYFEWTFGEPTHSIIQSFLRVLLFVLSLVILLKLYWSEFNFSTGHITMKLMFVLSILNVVVINPFWFLTYFTNSRLLRIIDSILVMFLIVSTVFVSVVVLLIGDLKNNDISKNWLLLRSIPFLAAYVFFFAGSLYSSVSIHKDPLSTTTTAAQAFAVIKIIIYISSIISLIIGSVIFQSEFPQEKLLYLGFSVVFLTSLITCEIYSTFKSSLGVSRIVQIYSLVAVSIFNLF